MKAIIGRLSRDKRGVSNVIVVMLSLALIVIIVGKVVLWSYEMNQRDLERMQEKVTISSVTWTNGLKVSLRNSSPSTAHVVAVWIINSTNHQRFVVSQLMNSGEADIIYVNASSPGDEFFTKVVTERGNVYPFP